MARSTRLSEVSGRQQAVRHAPLRPGRPSLHQTFQLSAHIHTTPQSAEADFATATRLALTWLQQKWPERLPKVAMEGGNFEGDQHGQRLDLVALPESGQWAAKLLQPDMPFKETPAVPGRTWITELCLAKGERIIDFGVRILCSSLEFSEAPIALTRPRIVRDLAAKLNLHGARVIDGKPWLLNSEADLEELASLLTDPRRTMPTVVLTQPDGNRLRTNVKPWLLDADRLARELLGVAYVVLLPTALGWDWSNRYGRPWGAYLGAVRVFHPGLDFDRDSPYSHPLRVAEDILLFRHAGKQGEEAYEEFLIEKAFENAAGRILDWGSRRFVADLRGLRSERMREELSKALSTAEQAATTRTTAKQAQEAANKYRESLNLAEEQIRQLKNEVDEWQRFAQDCSAETSAAKGNLQLTQRENTKLAAMIHGLRKHLEAKTGKHEDSSIPLPESYEEIADWIETHMLDRVFLHPRALRGLSRARYEDPKLVVQALLLLAIEYRNMRLGEPGGKEAYERRRNELTLRDGGSISETKAGEQGEEYFIEYPAGSGRKHFLEFHLRKGASKDERYCMAVYFFWDPEGQRVVVGWLPSHLDNRMT